MTEKVSGKIDVKGYQTKYDFGDTFWIMANSAPEELIVTEIEINITLKTFQAYYTLQGSRSGNRRRTEKELDSFPRTKEELCKQVFQI